MMLNNNLQDERKIKLLNLLLNDQKHLQRFFDKPCAFSVDPNNIKSYDKSLQINNRGNFWAFDSNCKKFIQLNFELSLNILILYSNENKEEPFDVIQTQNYQLTEENDQIGELTCYGLVLQNDEGIIKLVSDKFLFYKQWLKGFKKFCKIPDFLARYKVENRIYEHFYRCVDKKKKIYTAVKIVNKKGLKNDQKMFVDNEIMIIRKVQCPLFPHLKKVYEDVNYIYLTFQYFKGDDLKNIVQNSKLEEIAVATLAYHLLKGLKILHKQNMYHGNLKLENIIFSTNKKDNEIFLINFKYGESCEELRDKLIKKGNNLYIAPEVLDFKQFDQQIDMFSLGVCIYFMIFKKSPYMPIDKKKFQVDYDYQLDMSLLEKMKSDKKKDPQLKQILSATGIDFLSQLLNSDPQQRPTAQTAMNHAWFINFTNKQLIMGKKGKNGAFMDNENMPSLRTIIECSEMSEREIQELNLDEKILQKTFQKQQIKNQIVECYDDSDGDQDDEFEVQSDDDTSQNLNQLIFQLDFNVMAPSKKAKTNFINQQTEYQQSLNNSDIIKHFNETKSECFTEIQLKQQQQQQQQQKNFQKQSNNFPQQQIKNNQIHNQNNTKNINQSQQQQQLQNASKFKKQNNQQVEEKKNNEY